MKKPTVFLVDDDASVRRAVRMILEAAEHSVECYESAQDFLDHFDMNRSGCLVSDVRMPGMNGMELLRRLTELGASIPVLLLSAHGDIRMAVDAMKIGAIDFLEKPIPADLLRERVALALMKDADQRTNEAGKREIQDVLETLTARESEILELIAGGKSTKLIALALGTSPNTVRVQRCSIMRKMQADTDADLVRMLSVIGYLVN